MAFRARSDCPRALSILITSFSFPVRGGHTCRLLAKLLSVPSCWVRVQEGSTRARESEPHRHNNPWKIWPSVTVLQAHLPEPLPSWCPPVPSHLPPSCQLHGLRTLRLFSPTLPEVRLCWTWAGRAGCSGRTNGKKPEQKPCFQQHYQRNRGHEKVTFIHSIVCVINTTYYSSF